MTLSISMSPESEAKLRERAAAAGQDVSAFVRDAIAEKLAGTDAGLVSASPLQGDREWFERFNEWIASHPPRQYLADHSRDAIYSDEPD